LGVLLALVAVGVLGFSASAFAETKTEVFEASKGSSFEFQVPAGVTQVEVTAIGGAGVAGHACSNRPVAPGGSGAKVTAVLPVSATKTLSIDFGKGASGGSGSAACAGGGSGGGASTVLNESSELLVLAGGGGGGGGSVDGSGGVGGSASGLDGGNGTPPSRTIVLGAGGEGGSELAAGKGGAGAEGSFPSCEEGEPGSGEAGGDGGGECEGVGEGGGGGGGGYNGGGGGGAGRYDAGGGGAGSSYIDESLAGGKVESGAGSGQVVTVSYALPSTPCFTAVGYGQYVKLHEAKSLLQVTAKLSTNLSKAQELRVNGQDGKARFALSSLTSAKCSVTGSTATFSGEGRASEPTEGHKLGWTVRFAITVSNGQASFTGSLRNKEGAVIHELSSPFLYSTMKIS